jgi:hypothetical protein
MSGGGGDAAGLVGRHLPSLSSGPNLGEPVPQIQRNHRSAGWVFGAGQPALADSLAGVQVGPVGGDLQPPCFGGDQGVFVGLGGG